MESKYNSLSLGSLVQEDDPPAPSSSLSSSRTAEGKKKKKKTLSLSILVLVWTSLQLQAKSWPHPWRESKVSNIMSLDQRGLFWHGISGFLSSYNNLDLQIEVKQAICRNKKTNTTPKHKGRLACVFKRARILHHVKALLFKLCLHWTERWRKT